MIYLIVLNKMNAIANESIDMSNTNHIRIEKFELGNEFKSSLLYCLDDFNRVDLEVGEKEEEEKEEEEEEKDLEEEEEEKEEKNVNIYRYKFTQDVMDELHNFAKIHQFDDRHQFKEAWQLWSKEFEEMIRLEIGRLSYDGYNGDILDKMFKSARYYFKKKPTIKVQAKERREYISFQKDILNLMDQHIKTTKLKPANGFADFCNANMEALKKEIAYLVDHNITDSKMIQAKFKKTYKNRCFLLNK